MRVIIQYIEKELKDLYPQSEIRGFIRLIFEYIFRMDFTRQLLSRDVEPDPCQRKKTEEIVARLKRSEPLQYILGETEFDGIKIGVNPSVLIPRPETEELVQWISESVSEEPPTILDIGTGSGCIALALKKRFPDARVFGIDFSQKALETARRNARINHLEVSFLYGDVFGPWKTIPKRFDLVVSNPPYVRNAEKKAMSANVLAYEPAEALFVPDTDPLIFFREIARKVSRLLPVDGWLFFEINENLGAETAALMEEMGFRKVEIKRDLSGRSRMLRVRSTGIF